MLLHLQPMPVVPRAGGMVPQDSLRLRCAQSHDVLTSALAFSVQHESWLSDGLCNVGLLRHLTPRCHCHAGPYCKWFLKKLGPAGLHKMLGEACWQPPSASLQSQG